MTQLTGIDPGSPTPANLREFFFAQGDSLGPGTSRDVLLMGNRTSAGSETVDTLGDPIVDEEDCIARFGRRSEVYAMYRVFNLIPQQATIYAIAVTESGGSAAIQEFTVGGTVGVGGAIQVDAQGQSFQVPIFSTDASAAAIATRLAAYINDADEGRLQYTAAVDGGTPEQVNVTAAQAGPRGDLLFGADANHGLRMKIVGSTAVTITKGTLTSGTTADDNTAALAAAAGGEFYYQISAATATATTTATDSGVGEHSAYINTQLAPVNGKQQTVHFGLVGTHAEAMAVSNSVNLVTSFFWHAEESDWTPAMIAAHNCAVMRAAELAHPAANIAGYINGTGTPYFMPPAAVAADVPTPTQVDQDLNNGVTPIGYQGTGRKPYIVRVVTGLHNNATGQDDFRARPGHTPSVIFFMWEQFRSRYGAQKQDFTGPDPKDNEQPRPNTDTPDSIRSIFVGLIAEGIKGKAFGYDGAVLEPEDEQAMLDSISVTRIGGGFGGQVDWTPNTHHYFMRTKIRQVGEAY